MTERMALCISTLMRYGWADGVECWNRKAAEGPYPLYLEYGNKTLVSYNRCLRRSVEPLLGFVHDDVLVHEYGWDQRVLQQFDDPAVGVVGFAGALGHGYPDLYKGEFRLGNMGRSVEFRSGLHDAEAHGKRFTGECDVAVLDGMALFARRELFDKAGPWPEETGYWIYDYWLCCEARRHGYRIRMVGVACTHLGSASHATAEAQGLPLPESEDSEAANRWIYDRYRDVLPWEVKP